MRILLVEDEPSAARMLAKGLREQAYAVDIAGDGAPLSETPLELALVAVDLLRRRIGRQLRQRLLHLHMNLQIVPEAIVHRRQSSSVGITERADHTLGGGRCPS